MKRLIMLLLVAVWLPHSLLGTGDEIRLTRSQMQQSYCDLLGSIQAEFEGGYAPRYWKGDANGWSLDLAVEDAKMRILSETSTDRQVYQGIIRDFFASTKDYHVGVAFFNWDVSFLPFDVITVEGRTFIAYVYRHLISEAVFPYEVGDEVISFGGRPIAECIQELADQINGCNEQANIGIADTYLTFNSAARGEACNKGPVTVGILPKDGDKVKSVQLMWSFNECPCCQDPQVLEASIAMELPSLPERNSLTNPAQLSKMMEKFFNPKSELPHNEIFSRRARAMNDRYGNHHLIGSKFSIIPQLGATWWHAKPISSWWGGKFLPFQAYVYQTADNDHKVGFLRIGTYGCDPELLQETIAHMEEEVEVLIIDQMNNPGGYVMSLYSIASMLTDDALETPRHQLALCEEDYIWSKYVASILRGYVRSDADAQWLLGETWLGYPVSLHLVQMWLHHLDFVMENWEAGRILTDPIHIAGIDHIHPHPTTRFTKPVLLLTNALDFSCADSLPAILQDNDRVTIMGTRTAGAGGCVVGGVANTNDISGLMSFRFTNTLAWRANGQPIEDLGVDPDVYYDLTVDDVQNDCRGFVEAIHQQVSIMIANQGSE